MAVSIDNVYQRVLAIANKEQRGYVTPQEFNLFAHKAQLDIFDSYFHEVRQAEKDFALDVEYGDKRRLMEDKINIFKQYKIPVAGVGSNTWAFSIPNDCYSLGEVYYQSGAGEYLATQVNTRELHYLNKSNLGRPTPKRPIYTRPLNNVIRVYPPNNWTATSTLPHFSANNMVVNYVRKPVDPKWAYVVVQSKALYNGAEAIDFELHESEEGTLVNKILELAGITIQKPDLSAAAIRNQQINDAKEIR